MGVNNSSQVEINNAGNGAANISFHREGAYGAHFGLDTDNWFSTRGWSAGSTGYTNMRTGTLSATGEVRATSEITAYYSSDNRLKENVQLLNNPLELIEQIRGVRFDWTDSYIESRGGEDNFFVRKHDIGVIAQEVEKILPEIVAMRTDGYLAVKYEKLVPLLIEAIKELAREVEELKKKSQWTKVR